MLKQYLTIIGAVIFLTIAFFFFEEWGKGDYLPLAHPSITPKVQEITTQTFDSNDGRISFSFPNSWYIVDTTKKGEIGQFGTYMQTWTVSNFQIQEAQPATIPTNGITIAFEILQGGSNLPIESLIDCSNKTITCEVVGIANEQFIKSTTTLNTGIQTITIATFYDQNVFRAHAMIATGDKQAANAAEVEKVFQSITFVTPSVAK